MGMLATLLLVLPALGQDDGHGGKLQVMVTPDTLVGRSDAPRWVNVKTVWEGAGLLEGRLMLDIHDGHSCLGSFRSGELVLPGGEQSFRVLLPGLRRHHAYNECRAHLHFGTERGVFEAGGEPFGIGAHNTRVVSIATARPDSGGGETWRGFVNSLRLDRFKPDRGPNAPRGLRSTVAFLKPEDFPVRPCGYLAYDVVALPSRYFVAMTETQLNALEAWILAGGSACILRGEELPKAHGDFLARMTERGEAIGTFWAKALVSEQERGDVCLLCPGLGRVLLARPEEMQRGTDTTRRRRIAGFLWRIRETQMLHIVEKGVWNDKPDKPADDDDIWDQGQGVRRSERRHLPLFPAIRPGGYSFCACLLPESIRIVPMPLIALLLGALVALIGPVEYWLHGLLRARPLTWVVFPATCLLFTWLVVLMGNHYMGRQDHARTLRVVDASPAGDCLRENRFELYFPARNRELARPCRNAAFSTLAPGWFMRQRHHYGYPPGTTEVPLPTVTGRFPEQFTAATELKQWRPELTRQFSIGGDPVPWRLPRNPSLNTDVGRKQTHAAFMKENPEFRGAVYAIVKDQYFTLKAPTRSDGNRVLLHHANEIQRFSTWQGTVPQLSLGPDVGFFAVVSQLSPNGGNMVEDLHILDPSNEEAALWVTITEDDGELTVTRTLYRGGSE